MTVTPVTRGGGRPVAFAADPCQLPSPEPVACQVPKGAPESTIRTMPWARSIVQVG